ncbi:pentapeptide repeat-containing protein [Mycetocola zhujimingii]|nr:pentapeptide repeat-containing protein [Mycetocola zhujimingii]
MPDSTVSPSLCEASMARRPSTHPPRLDTLRVVERAPGDADSLDTDDDRELEEFSGVDFSDRDLSGITLRECSLDDVTLTDANLRGSRLIESVLTGINAPILRSSRSTWRDVTLSRSRIGSGELFDATWQSVRISGSKLGYVNLRGSSLTDVLFEDCTIDELDLGGANATRVAFTGTRVQTLDLTRSTLTHVDLRGLEFQAIHGLEGLKGATVSEYQLSELAPLFATQLGILVEG